MLMISKDSLPGSPGPTEQSAADDMAVTITAGTAASAAYNKPLMITKPATASTAVLDF